MRSASAKTASMSCSTSRIVCRPLSARSSCDHALRTPRAPCRPSARRAAAGAAAWPAPWRSRAGAARRAPGVPAGTSARVAEPDLRRAARAPARAAPRSARRRPPEAEAVAGVRLHRQRDVVERGELAEDAGDLERARQAARASARGAGSAVTSRAGEADRAGIGPQLAGELGDQRRLAGAVGADDGVQSRPRATSRSTPSVATSAAEALAQAARSRAAAQPPRAPAPASRPQSPRRANSTTSTRTGPRIDLPVLGPAPTARPPAAGRRRRRAPGRTACPCRRGSP